MHDLSYAYQSAQHDAERDETAQPRHMHELTQAGRLARLNAADKQYQKAVYGENVHVAETEEG